MRRRDILVVPAMLTRAPVTEDFLLAASEFEKHWVRFINGLAGCPPDTLEGLNAKCDPAQRHFDVRAFNQAKKAWKKVAGE